jgi:hypothetical protein
MIAFFLQKHKPILSYFTNVIKQVSDWFIAISNRYVACTNENNGKEK